jgi:hypothetical protein
LETAEDFSYNTETEAIKKIIFFGILDRVFPGVLKPDEFPVSIFFFSAIIFDTELGYEPTAKKTISRSYIDSLQLESFS